MLKVGDKLLCKKKYTSYMRGKYYYVLKISKGYNNNYVFIYLKNDNNIKDWFNFTKKSDYYIWNYFYTPKEIRRMKLKQLNL